MVSDGMDKEAQAKSDVIAAEMAEIAQAAQKEAAQAVFEKHLKNASNAADLLELLQDKNLKPYLDDLKFSWSRNPFKDEPVTPVATKKRGGRPKGSKNKTKPAKGKRERLGEDELKALAQTLRKAMPTNKDKALGRAAIVAKLGKDGEAIDKRFDALKALLGRNVHQVGTRRLATYWANK